ncbi:hypothetical protein C8P68_102560 [Mucilaginibacter yixingensis]|uniref:Uncharacterized protein n=1 Tax=Mucilaginibacter yixingensis TaxID=1295612 RepID=A0A2T5JD83_9SPHI|nr:hypothetical protein [Mucilaginibacter yixingensis]PTQ99730.1 hypothetical protein C8P68_102560 [Mucilaginibacter yixingensis]
MSLEYYMPLGFGLTSKDVRHYYDQYSPLDNHELVIRPILYNSENAYVYELNTDSELYLNNSNILIKDKGKFKFDTSKECIKGHEYLWNAQRRTRGSIVIVCDANRIDLRSIFAGCFWVGIAGTPNTGQTLTATKLCKKEANNGKLAFCFSATNGLETMLLYVAEPLRSTILKDSLNHLPDFINRR